MQHDIELGYVGIEVPDPSCLDAFFGEVIGLVPGQQAGEWRNDSKASRVKITEGPANDATIIGFEATSDEAYERTIERLKEAGYDVDGGRTMAPWGVAVEVVRKMDEGEPWQSGLMPGGFLTDGMGFGHAVFATTAFEDADRFLRAGLGMIQSDSLEMELGPGIVLEVHFYHCNERHHSIAIAKPPFEMPQRLHHLMFETNERDDVGAAFDRVWNTDLTIANGLGQHPNDGMFSFYVVSPAGFQVEVGHDGRRVTDPWTDDRVYDRISSWGHQPVKR